MQSFLKQSGNHPATMSEPETLRLVHSYCKDEFTDCTVYRELAKREKNADRKQVLEQLSAKELEHYEFWSKHAQGYQPKVSPLLLRGVVLLRTLFGLTFTLKFLERTEHKTIAGYKDFLLRIPRDDKPTLESIIRDEEEHERYFISQINEGVVQYMSFIVLGLADAIVEITGVHAGFLGVTSSTLIAGISGLVVGFAAAISMASAAYLQAKHDPTRSPMTSAISTGIAYIGAVALLALPYFLTHDMLFAFGGSVTLALALTAAFTFYGAILTERMFTKEFAVSVALTLGTALGAYLFGELLGRIFGIREAMHLTQ